MPTVLWWILVGCSWTPPEPSCATPPEIWPSCANFDACNSTCDSKEERLACCMARLETNEERAICLAEVSGLPKEGVCGAREQGHRWVVSTLLMDEGGCSGHQYDYTVYVWDEPVRIERSSAILDFICPP